MLLLLGRELKPILPPVRKTGAASLIRLVFSNARPVLLSIENVPPTLITFEVFTSEPSTAKTMPPPSMAVTPVWAPTPV